MDEMSREAASNGLTPEILQSILDDEESASTSCILSRSPKQEQES